MSGAQGVFFDTARHLVRYRIGSKVAARRISITQPSPGTSSARVGNGPALGELGPQLTQPEGPGQVTGLQADEQAVVRTGCGDRRHVRLDALVGRPVTVHRHLL